MEELRWMVAADGAASPIRKQLGITFGMYFDVPPERDITAEGHLAVDGQGGAMQQ